MRRGFTLVELLGIIIILGIVTTIAVPTVTTIIENSKKASARRSVDFFGKAIETEITRYDLENGIVIEGSFETADGHTLYNKNNQAEILNVYYSGKKVTCETIEIYSDKSVYLDECTVGDKIKIEYSYGTQ